MNLATISLSLYTILLNNSLPFGMFFRWERKDVIYHMLFYSLVYCKYRAGHKSANFSALIFLGKFSGLANFFVV
jgi:hypothetical protein